MSNRLKVAQILASFVSGGIERIVRSIVEPMQDRGIDFTILTLNDQIDRAGDVEPLGVRVHPLSSHWKPVRFPIFPFPAEVRRLEEFLAQERFGLVHAHHHACIAAAPRIARICGVPYCVTHHNIREPWQSATGPRAILYRRLMRRSFEGAGRVFPISQAVADEIERFVGHPLRNATLLENCVDDRFWQAADSNANRDRDVMMVGRLAPQKNVLFALDVFAELKRRRPTLTVTMIGGGPQEGEVRSKIAELGLQSTVRLLGESDTDTIVHWANRSKVLYMPSLFEGLSVTFLEAMALGLDAVVSTIPGFTRTFPDVEGVRFADNASLEANVAELQAAIDGYLFRARPEFHARFNRDSYCDRLAAAYRELAAR